MRDVFIVEAVRTPIGRGREDGALHGIHPVDLLARTLDALMTRAEAGKEHVEDIVTGCVTPINEQGANIARLAGIKAGFPIEVPGLQLNRFCGSGQQAVHFAAQAIAAGDMEMAIGSGVEMMGTVTMGSDAKFTPEFREAMPVPLLHQGVSAEMVAEKWSLSRQALDEFSARSHCLAAAAQRQGWSTKEMMPIALGSNGSSRVLDRDEGVRDKPDLGRMGALKPAFKEGGVITAANSSQISDGAGAVLLASGAKAAQLGLRKRARIVTRVVVGSDPVLMLTGPINATRAALHKSGLKASEIDAFEINEAFASVVLAWEKEIQPDMNRVNIQGGAIAHGHPIGATGSILMAKLLHLLERTGGRFGLQTMCIGFGMATATIIERLD